MARRTVRTAKTAGSSEDSASTDDLTEYELPLIPDLTATRSPTERFRRADTALAFLGTGCLGVGSALLITFYVTGPPRFDDLASTTTVVLLLTLVAGLASSLPNWLAAVLMLLGRRPSQGTVPPHGRALRIASLLALTFATLHAISGVVLYILLEKQDSFVTFCMQNIPTAVTERCIDQWNRNWVIILAVTIVLLFSVGLGFPVFRYTRASSHPRENDLLDLQSSRIRPARRTIWLAKEAIEAESAQRSFRVECLELGRGERQ